MKFKYKDLARLIEKKVKEKGVIYIGIDGPGGSGKSFFTSNLMKYLNECQVIHFDDFYYQKNSKHHNYSTFEN